MPESYKEGKTYLTLKSGQRTITRLPKGAYGSQTGFIAIAAPVFDDDNNFIAQVGVVKSTTNYDNLINSGQELLAAAEEIFASAENLANKGQDLSKMAKKMNSETSYLKEDAQSIGEISGEITKVSSLSSILGINASIEAARAGEKGLGFRVVANEVIKLAEETKTSSKNIDQKIKKVQDSIAQIAELIKDTGVFTEAQAEGIEELKCALENISVMAENLVKLGTVMERGQK